MLLYPKSPVVKNRSREKFESRPKGAARLVIDVSAKWASLAPAACGLATLGRSAPALLGSWDWGWTHHSPLAAFSSWRRWLARSCAVQPLAAAVSVALAEAGGMGSTLRSAPAGPQTVRSALPNHRTPPPLQRGRSWGQRTNGSDSCVCALP